VTTKETLHRLVDAIPERNLDPAPLALEPLADPVVFVLASAPEEDEPLSAEEEAMIAEARAEYQRGEFVSDAEFDTQLNRQRA
jgi:hypothetical protein